MMHVTKEFLAHSFKQKSQQETEKKRQKREQLQREWRRKEAELVKQGKQPYFLKKCNDHYDSHYILLMTHIFFIADQRKLEVLKRYETVKERLGGNEEQAALAMEKLLEKRRKRNANKDHRWMPMKRRAK